MRNSGHKNIQQPMSKDELRRAHAIRRKKLKKRRQRRVYSLLLLVFVCVGIALSLTVFFPIKEITVEGNTLYDQEEILSISGLIVGENLFLSDTKTASLAIEEAFPYVGQALIKRKIPDKIAIQITHTSPKYALQTGEQYALLNELGKVLETGKQEVPEGIAIVKGAEVSESILGKNVVFKDTNTVRLIEKIVNGIEKNELQGITQIDLTDTFNITLNYQNRIELILGTEAELEKKFEMAAEVLGRQNASNSNQHGKIDLSIVKKAYFSPTTAPTQETQATAGVQ